jgi:AcrR family transcriptional regulator
MGRRQAAPRKRPQQERARATVDAILAAAAHVLVAEGYDRASTNKIAARAGVSVGSLYQYYPSKEAIVAALSEAHVQELLGVLAAAAHGGPADEAPLPLIRRLIRAMLHAHAVDPALHQVLSEQIPLHVAGARFEDEAAAIVRGLLSQHRGALRDGLDVEVATFVLMHAVEAVTHAAVIERPQLLREDVLGAELVRLVTGYLLPAPR